MPKSDEHFHSLVTKMLRSTAIWISLSCGALLSAATGSNASAQMIHSSVPFHNLNSNFYEGNSIGWSLRGRNWFANFGGGGPLLPPFAPPGAVNNGLSGGFGSLGGGLSGSLRFNFAQGSNQSISSTTPSLTTMDGVPGSISSGVLRPFVTSVTPVVSGGPTIVGPPAIIEQVRQQQLSSLRQSHAALQSKKLDQYLRRGELAESEGNKRMARANYRSAIALANEPLRTQIQQRLQAMMQSKP